MRTCVGLLKLTHCGFHTIVFTHTWVAPVINAAIPGNDGVISNDCGDAGNRSVSYGVGIREADADDVKHGAEDEDVVIREIDVDDGGAEGGGGIGNDCCDVGDRSVNDGLGTSKDDGDGVVNGGVEDEDVGVRDKDDDGAGAKGGGGIGIDCRDVGDRSVSNGVGTTKAGVTVAYTAVPKMKMVSFARSM